MGLVRASGRTNSYTTGATWMVFYCMYSGYEDGDLPWGKKGFTPFSGVPLQRGGTEFPPCSGCGRFAGR